MRDFVHERIEAIWPAPGCCPGRSTTSVGKAIRLADVAVEIGHDVVGERRREQPRVSPPGVTAPR